VSGSTTRQNRMNWSLIVEMKSTIRQVDRKKLPKPNDCESIVLIKVLSVMQFYNITMFQCSVLLPLRDHCWCYRPAAPEFAKQCVYRSLVLLKRTELKARLGESSLALIEWVRAKSPPEKEYLTMDYSLLATAVCCFILLGQNC